MGSVKKVLKKATKAVGKVLGVKTPKISKQAAKDLETEKNKMAKQRVRLFATQGEERGEEVLTVGSEKKRRGRVYGN